MVEQRMRMAAVDIDLGEHRKCHVILALAEFFDLFGVARLLPAELVAGKAEHRKAARRKFTLQLLQALVLRREPAGARGVDDQEHQTFKPLQRNLFAGERTRRKIINAWHRVLSKSAGRIDRRRRCSTGFDRLAGSKAQVLAVTSGNQLYADGHTSDQSG